MRKVLPENSDYTALYIDRLPRFQSESSLRESSAKKNIRSRFDLDFIYLNLTPRFYLQTNVDLCSSDRAVAARFFFCGLKLEGTHEKKKKTVWFRYVDIDAKNLFLLARIATRGKVIALFAESLVFVFPHFRENLSQNKTGFSSSILFF